MFEFKVMSHDNSNMCVPSLEWLGLKLDDLDRFLLDRKENYLFELNKHDRMLAVGLTKKLTDLQEYELIKQVKSIYFNNLNI